MFAFSLVDCHRGIATSGFNKVVFNLAYVTAVQLRGCIAWDV